tara:strand:+ start:1094 stop:3646 length:2553 start_codon:yes stop_codon:yes gene_type:complete
MAATIDGIVNEPTVNFVGKDGFFWWVGEVEDNEDPMELGRVKTRILGYYTNVQGGTTADLPTDKLPWATVLQHTSQAGNDGQGESSGQLQPGAIVMGFFMDGENAQMPIVIGVLRVSKSADTETKQVFAFTGEKFEDGLGVNHATKHPTEPNASLAVTKGEGYKRQGNTNAVCTPGMKTCEVGGTGSPKNIGTATGITGGAVNPVKPLDTDKPLPAANGVGGPWKSLEYKLSYLIEDIAETAGALVKTEKDGEYISMITGKLVTAKQLTAKLQNFLGAVFTQVIAAIRQALANLAEQLELVNLLGGATGIPFVVFTTIQKAVTLILSQLCIIDNQLLGYIADPVGSITSIVENFLNGLIDKAAMVLQGVQQVIDDIVCNVQKILDSALGIVSSVKTIVDGIGKAKEIIEAWEKGTEIFETATDLFKKGLGGISGLMALFIKFTASNCNRPIDGGKDTVGWYPLFGVTHCTEEELASINSIRGRSQGKCGDNESGKGLIDNLFNSADPYLTAATTYINGAYELFVGVPGREATQRKNENGTTFTSVKINNKQHAKWKWLQEKRKQKPDLTDEQLEVQYTEYLKKQTTDNNDDACLVADHSSYAGNHTSEVHGDDCANIDGDYVRTIDGDYHLKITGDCHLEVGGGFFLDAEGAPKVVDKKGNKKNTRVQKHSLKFGSDVDMSVTGAKFELQGAEANIASTSTKITGSIFENTCSQQTRSGAEMIFTADNSITLATTTLFETINFPPSPIPKIKAGIIRKIGGSCETVMTPAGSAADAIPRYIVANPAGPVSVTSGATGYNNNVLTGLYNVNVAAGAISMNSSTAASIVAGAAMNLTAGAVMKLTAASIFLN